MNKETAVEWFVKELFKKIDYIQVDPKLIEQALAMEKKQIVNAWYDCKLSIVDKKPMDAEDYYNETYGGEQ